MDFERTNFSKKGTCSEQVDLPSYNRLKTMSQKKVSDRHAEHKKRQAQRQRGYKKAPDLSIVGRRALRDELALQLERSASTQGQAETVPLYSTSKTSPAPVMLPLIRVETRSTNPTDHSLSQRVQRSAGCTNPNKLIQL